MSVQEATVLSPSQQPTQPQKEHLTTPFSLRGIAPNEPWPEATKDHLFGALNRTDDGTTIYEVRDHINRQRSMLWVGYLDSVHVMSAVLSTENNALYAWLLGGYDMDEWIDSLVSAMRRYAKENGLTHLKAVTRPGLARKLKGWRTTATIIRAEL